MSLPMLSRDQIIWITGQVVTHTARQRSIYRLPANI